MSEPEDKNTEDLTPEELAHTHLPEHMMYKIQTADAEGADTDDVQHPPQTIRTNEFRCLYFELKPDEKIDWHTHVPDLDEVNLCLEGRAKYTLEREDGSHQTLEIGPMEFVYRDSRQSASGLDPEVLHLAATLWYRHWATDNLTPTVRRTDVTQLFSTSPE